MNAVRRATKKANRAAAGRHTGLDHEQRQNPDHPAVLHVHDNGKVHQSGSPLPVNCQVCRPPSIRKLVHGDGQPWRR